MSTVELASNLFKTNPKFLQSFDRIDPFTGNAVSGLICRKKGPYGGSLLLTQVNGQAIEPYPIYGTPKLVYPYQQNTRDYQDIKAISYYIADKWNGVNLLFFRYYDAAGQSHISCKTKGAPFVSNSLMGMFLDLTQEMWAQKETKQWVEACLKNPKVVAIGAELCGRKEPHLVKYDFDLAIKPLFRVFDGGKIEPIMIGPGPIYYDKSPKYIASICQDFQKYDLQQNEKFRAAQGLPHKYEFNHFATEGRVLYSMDEYGFVIDRTMYKIKPSDIEEVHWATFDTLMEGRVREAIQKLQTTEQEITYSSLQEELDMGPKEWSKFSRPIIKYCLGCKIQIKSDIV